jgi:RHS repeat-associated protein
LRQQGTLYYNSILFKTMDNKTGVGGNVISTPTGGGAITGMGEKFSPDLFTGTGNFSVPIALPPGRNGLQPQLSIGYSTGNGGSPFGLGWNLSIPGVSRKTSKGIPLYDDSKDVFILSGAEDLIPVADALAPSNAQCYRPRTEGLFARIYRFKDVSNDYWEVWSKDGLKSYYGTPGAANTPAAFNDPAVCADPAYKSKVFQWYLTKTIDVFGNVILYDYDRVPVQDAEHDSDMIYLSRIRYADYVDGGTTTYLCSVSFVYEERPDPFSFYKQGFEMRITKRCTQIDVYTHPDDSDVLTKTYHFIYLDARVVAGELAASVLPINNSSMLSQVRVEGHDGDASESMPPLEFGYTVFNPTDRNFAPIKGSDLPSSSLADGAYELADLFGSGMPDLFQLNTNLGVARYWRNLGKGTFDRPQNMPLAPAAVDLADPGVQLMDANGDGKLDLFVNRNGYFGYYPLQQNGLWNRNSYQSCKYVPSFSLSDPEVKLLDLDGDGITDVLRNGSRFECFFNDPVQGFYKVKTIEKKQLTDFPDVSFADPRVRTADMSGDGMQDIVLLYDGRIDYWPNLGYGNWGKKVRMKHAPRLPYRFNPEQLLIGDVDGDGLSDLIYVENNKVTLWMNRGGDSWSEAIVIQGTPPLRDMRAIRLADMLGTGVAGILWSYDFTTNPNRERMYFLDFTHGTKPYVLQEMNNNMGAITRVHYKPSTYYYLRDQPPRAGGVTDPTEIGALPNGKRTPWLTTLPFPVQVVSRVEVIDAISNGKLVTEYSYHHGYWDGGEREFRGFGRVHQRDTEGFERYNGQTPNNKIQITNGGNNAAEFNKVQQVYYAAPTESISWFHLGPIGDEHGDWKEAGYEAEYWSGDRSMLQRPKEMITMIGQLPRRARRDAYRTLRGSSLRSELYALDGTARQNRPYTVSENLQGMRVEHAFTPAVTKNSNAIAIYGPDENNKQGSGYIFFSFGMASRSSQWERGEEPLTTFSFSEAYDAYGTPLIQIGIAVPRGKNPLLRNQPSGTPYLATCGTSTVVHKSDSTHYLIGRAISASSYEVLNNGNTSVFELKDFVLNELNSDVFVNLTRLSFGLTYYDGTAFTGLGYGLIGDYGIPVRSESLVFDQDLLDAIYGSHLPPYILQSGSPVWTGDYPAVFRTDVPANAGYVYYDGSDGIHVPGYYAGGQKAKFDFQVDPSTATGLVLQMQDILGNTASITYDEYKLLPLEVSDPVGMTTSAAYDYRVMQAKQVTEPNGNRVQLAFTPLGFVNKTAVMGKVTDVPQHGDTLDDPGTLLEYNFFAWMDDAQPVFVKSTVRENHIRDGINNATLVSVQYSDGFGRLIQARAQCEEVIFGDSIFGDSGLVASGADGTAVGVENTTDTLNVLVNGWKVYDNKGRVVETYEPYYDTGFDFISPLSAGIGADALARSQKVQLYYDPRGQVIRTVNPDKTEQRVLFGVPLALDNPAVFTPTPWESYSYDANDLAELTHPGDTTVPVGHHYTPSSGVIDALGRSAKTTDRNFKSGVIEEVVMQYTYDIRGNQLTVLDPYSRTVFDNSYDLANRPLRTTHIDAGTKYIFIDALNRPTEARDAKGALVLSAYDNLSRPVKVWCRDKTGESVLLRSKTIYGDDPASGLPAPADLNMLGKPYKVYDEAGLTTMNLYDFKGNLMEKTREVIADSEILAVFSGPPVNWNVSCYRVNWDATVTLEGSYVSSMEYDALNRTRSVTYPQDVDGQRKILLPTYNKGGALTKVDLKDTALSSPVNYVDRIAYNAKGQQLLVAYGNGIMTRYLYRSDNFRLLRLKSEKYTKSGLTYTPNSGVKQNYSYEYDLSGNIINLSDITPDCGYGATPNALSRDFIYDALYRLLSATGRETAATGITPWEDLYRPQDESLARGYTQQYSYDKLGNIQGLQHIATGGNFTRTFGYDSPFNTNKLDSITIGSNTYNFAYDVNGNMLSEGDIARHLEYDCADRLRAFFVQTPLAEPSKYTHYLYDGGGNRVKKITRKQGGGYSSTTYIDGAFEYTKESSGFDAIPNLTIGTWIIGSYSSGGEQNILNLMGGATRRIGAALGDTTPAIKYNLDDHLGSSCLQLDTNGTTVSLEEYYPFGETSFGSYAKKRYRFCGKEKDEESGLYYYGMRYYSPWTCRFINVDPLAGKTPILSPYCYANCNPVMMNDPTGGEAEGIPEGGSGNSTTTSQNPDTTTSEEPNTTTTETDTSGVSIYYSRSSGKTTFFTVNDGKNQKYYEHPQGTHEFAGKKYIPIVSERSFTGHEEFSGGETDDVLVKDFSTWLVNYMKNNGVRNMGEAELLLKVNNSRVLDVAYNQGNESGGGSNPLSNLAEKHGSESYTKKFYFEYDQEAGKPPYYTIEYTNAMFLLPNGKYGNANEAGNYLIGFANGYSNANVSMSDLAQVWSLYDHLFNKNPSIQLDEPHKQNLIKEAGIMGAVNYYIYWWENIGSKLDVDQWAKKEQQDLYNSYMNKYKGNPLINQ